MSCLFNDYRNIILLVAFVVISGLHIINNIDRKIERQTIEERQLKLLNKSATAAAHLQNGINNYATVVSGIRSHIYNSQENITPQSLQNYLKHLYTNLPKSDTIIVSFVDQDNIFKYSISHNSRNINELDGTSVNSIRDENITKTIEELLQSNELKLFKPINLVEGWAGIGLCFRLIKDDKVLGFFAPHINLKSILNELYLDGNSEELVYKFIFDTGIIFDREAVYDGTTIYNSQRDKESFTLFDLEDKDFTFTSFEIYGKEFKVGAAYKKPLIRYKFLFSTLYSWLLFLVLGIIASFLYWKMLLSKNYQLNEKNNELVESNKALKHFTIATSHDLKEPLRTIGSFSSLLNKRYEHQLDETAKSYLGFINSGISHMNQLLADLYNYSKIIHKEQIVLEKIDLNQLVQKVLQSLEGSIQEKKVKFSIQELPVVKCQKTHMHQLYQNLISNAIKFNNNSDLIITIGAKREEQELIYYVKDNGIGIPEVYQEKIFELFQSLSREHSGTGMGLAICKKIVELYDGELWVNSSEGKGAKFYFSLPACG